MEKSERVAYGTEATRLRACRKCGVLKPEKEYGKASHRKDGLTSKCKNCLSEYRKSPNMKEYFRKRKENGTQNEVLNRYRQNHRSEIREKARKKRRDNPEQLREKERRYRQEVRRRALSALGGRCAQCGEQEPRFLAIDHINNDGAKERLHFRGAAQLAAAIATGRADASRYQVLCHNHNREKQLITSRTKDRNDSPHGGGKKKCSRCGLVKPTGCFPFDQHKSTGRKSECKACGSSRAADRKKSVINSFGGRCSCCGNDVLDHLELDHIDESGASRRRSGEDQSIYLKLSSGQMGRDHLQVLCANCNMGKTLNEGVCPHRDGSYASQ